MATSERALTANELRQLVSKVMVWPGDLMSKDHCRRLIKKGLAMSHEGNYAATAEGVRILRSFRDAVKERS